MSTTSSPRDVDDEVLAAAAGRPRSSRPVERVQRRVERLQRVDARAPASTRSSRRASASSSRRAVISTSGSSGTAPCRMLRRRAVRRDASPRAPAGAAGRSARRRAAVEPHAATPPFLRSIRAPVRSCTTCEKSGSWPTTRIRSSACTRSSSASFGAVKPSAQRLVLERLAPSASQASSRRVARPDLRARVDGLERRSRARRARGRRRATAPPRAGQRRSSSRARAVRLGLAMAQEPELACHRPTVTSSPAARHRACSAERWSSRSC